MVGMSRQCDLLILFFMHCDVGELMIMMYL